MSPSQRRPDFFIVGHPKCGTTALYETLQLHPEVFLTRPKEPHYLATELRYRPQWGEFGGLPKTMDEYLALFADAEPGQRAGESSAWYLWSHSAAAEIAALQPQARIVAFIREPASFLRSLHLQCVQARIEPERDLRRAIELEDARREGAVPKAPRFPTDWPQVLPAAGGLVYSSYIRYVEQLRRFHDLFTRENVLVLIYEDYRSDNEATLRRVHRFLGVTEDQESRVADANPTVRVRSRRANDLLRSLYMGQGTVSRKVKKGLKAVVPSRRLRRYAVERAQHQLLYTDPHPPDEELMAELRRRFEPEVVALGEYLDRDLVSLWGYERVE